MRGIEPVIVAAGVMRSPNAAKGGEDMDYRKFGETWYIRMDRGDEVIRGILDVCEREGIRSAVFSGIGGLSRAEVQTFRPERGEFETEAIEGMLELVCLNGNVIVDADGARRQHTHALLAYKDGAEHRVAGGHVKSLTVLYTAEIELRPVVGGEIRWRFNPETGTGFWDFGK